MSEVEPKRRKPTFRWLRLIWAEEPAVEVELSGKSLENLFKVLQTLNLAVTTISLVLLSNVALLTSRWPTIRSSLELDKLLEISKAAQGLTGMDLILAAAKATNVKSDVPWAIDAQYTVPADWKDAGSTKKICLVIPALGCRIFHHGQEFVRMDDEPFPNDEKATRRLRSRQPSFEDSPDEQELESEVSSLSRRADELQNLHDLTLWWNALAEIDTILVPGDKDQSLHVPDVSVSLVGSGAKTDLAAVSLQQDPSVPLVTSRTKYLKCRAVSVNPVNSSDDKSDEVRLAFFFDVPDQSVALPTSEPRGASMTALMYTSLLLKVPGRRVEIKPLNALLKRIPDIPASERFEEAFPDLAQLPRQYQTERVTVLKARLESDSLNGRQELEIFGAKIPSELFVLFGIPALTVLLFQFSSICAYICRRNETIQIQDASEWSFLLGARFLALLRYSTTLILPCTAAILSVAFVTPNPNQSWLWWALAALTFAGSLSSTISLMRLRRRVSRGEGIQRDSDDKGTLDRPID